MVGRETKLFLPLSEEGNWVAGCSGLLRARTTANALLHRAKASGPHVALQKSGSIGRAKHPGQLHASCSCSDCMMALLCIEQVGRPAREVAGAAGDWDRT